MTMSGLCLVTTLSMSLLSVTSSSHASIKAVFQADTKALRTKLTELNNPDLLPKAA
jgi:hypothetical protein